MISGPSEYQKLHKTQLPLATFPCHKPCRRRGLRDSSDASRLFQWRRRRPWRRNALARSHIPAASLGVLLGRRQRNNLSSTPRAFPHLPQIGPAPTASRPGSKALGDLTWRARLLNANKVLHLPPGDVKAETEFIVEVHALSVSRGSIRVR